MTTTQHLLGKTLHTIGILTYSNHNWALVVDKAATHFPHSLGIHLLYIPGESTRLKYTIQAIKQYGIRPQQQSGNETSFN